MVKIPEMWIIGRETLLECLITQGVNAYGPESRKKKKKEIGRYKPGLARTQRARAKRMTNILLSRARRKRPC